MESLIREYLLITIFVTGLLIGYFMGRTTRSPCPAGDDSVERRMPTKPSKTPPDELHDRDDIGYFEDAMLDIEEGTRDGRIL